MTLCGIPEVIIVRGVWRNSMYNLVYDAYDGGDATTELGASEAT